MKTRNLLLLVALAAFVAVLLLSLGSSVSQYTDFASARKAQGEVHVVATWVRRTEAAYDPARDEFRFYLADSLGTETPCVYPDPKPASFETAERVLVQGKYQGDAFQVSKIQLKCPSKYQETELAPEGYGTPAATPNPTQPS
ncbi:MAG: cytochrome c maturation protein CcmE [Bacteroidia bacterium]|nr:cytochrome c maturation protein CcmE [Bacteroidia bacterium]